MSHTVTIATNLEMAGWTKLYVTSFDSCLALKSARVSVRLVQTLQSMPNVI